MIDQKLLLTNLESCIQNLGRKSVSKKKILEVQNLILEKNKSIQKVEELRRQKNQKSQEIGQLMAKKEKEKANKAKKHVGELKNIL
ncbi:MAG: hypothetical protein OXC37_05855, partial [Bdellovibrionaceae bacterium]|nr:hypothetical protein [Pseudobdellovibrionaceae bacterium]